MPSPKTIVRPPQLVFVCDLDSRGGRNMGAPRFHVMGKSLTADDQAVVAMCGTYLRGGPTYRNRPKRLDFVGQLPPREEWCTKRGCLDVYADIAGVEHLGVLVDGGEFGQVWECDHSCLACKVEAKPPVPMGTPAQRSNRRLG